ncbi:putative transcriptional regulator [Terrisporobacter glycolicus]|nr:putative transcriptional regulator [Terrisporobacter glycolicus]
MGLNLKIARIKKGLKQREVAEKVGVSRDYIASLENGRSKNPSIKLMKKLSETLNVPVTELFFTEDDI